MGIATTGPNDAMIIAGVGYGSTPKIYNEGGWAFVLPCIHQVQKLTLNTLTIELRTDNIYTSEGVAINVVGIAQV